MEHPQSPELNNIDSSKFFPYLMQNSDSTVLILMDDKGYILDINMGVTRAFGYAKDDLIGQYHGVLFIEEDRNKKLPEMEVMTVLQKGSARDNNYVLHKNSTPIWGHGESVLVKDKKGKIYIIKIVYDINNQKMLEGFLIESNRRLEKVNKDLDNFVYAASHDLKTPINNIQGLIAALLQEIDEETKQKPRVVQLSNYITTSINRFHNTLADLAKVGVDTEQGVLEDIEFKDILKEVTLDLLGMINESGAIIEENFQVKTIHFSRKNLRSILHNLVSNALKFRSPERPPKVIISTKKEDVFVMLSVQDNGLGIAEEDKEKVFAFGKRLNAKVEGSGVGMNLVKRIVDINEGKIEIESEVEKGSTFKIYLKV